MYVQQSTKIINIHSWYRQWQELTPQGRVPNTRSIKAQKSRICKTAEFINKSIDESETIVMSDTNVNTHYLFDPDNTKPTQEVQIKQITEIFKEKFIDKGLTILNKDNTKPNNSNKMVVIDHIMTTHPALTSNTTTIQSHLSDHFPVMTYINTKSPVHTPRRYSLTRKYKDLNYLDLANDINNDETI